MEGAINAADLEYPEIPNQNIPYEQWGAGRLELRIEFPNHQIPSGRRHWCPTFTSCRSCSTGGVTFQVGRKRDGFVEGVDLPGNVGDVGYIRL